MAPCSRSRRTGGAQVELCGPGLYFYDNDVIEIAWRNGWLSDAQLSDLADPLVKSGYSTYLHNVLADARTQP